MDIGAKVPVSPPRTRTKDPEEFLAPSSDAELLDLCTGEGIGMGRAVGGVDEITRGPLCPEDAEMNMDFLIGRLSVGSCSLAKSLEAATMASKASLEVAEAFVLIPGLAEPDAAFETLVAMRTPLPAVLRRGSEREGCLRFMSRCRLSEEFLKSLIL